MEVLNNILINVSSYVSNLRNKIKHFMQQHLIYKLFFRNKNSLQIKIILIKI